MKIKREQTLIFYFFEDGMVVMHDIV